MNRQLSMAKTMFPNPEGGVGCWQKGHRTDIVMGECEPTLRAAVHTGGSGFHCKYSRTSIDLNSSNTDGSLAMANSNSFLSPYEILPLAQENK